MNGDILANGGDGTAAAYRAGGGSGGAIKLQSKVLDFPALAGRFSVLGGEIRIDLSGKERFVIGAAPQ